MSGQTLIKEFRDKSGNKVQSIKFTVPVTEEFKLFVDNKLTIVENKHKPSYRLPANYELVRYRIELPNGKTLEIFEDNDILKRSDGTLEVAYIEEGKEIPYGCFSEEEYQAGKEDRKKARKLNKDANLVCRGYIEKFDQEFFRMTDGREDSYSSIGPVFDEDLEYHEIFKTFQHKPYISLIRSMQLYLDKVQATYLNSIVHSTAADIPPMRDVVIGYTLLPLLSLAKSYSHSEGHLGRLYKSYKSIVEMYLTGDDLKRAEKVVADYDLWYLNRDHETDFDMRHMSDAVDLVYMKELKLSVTEAVHAKYKDIVSQQLKDGNFNCVRIACVRDDLDKFIKGYKACLPNHDKVIQTKYLRDIENQLINF